MAIKKPSSGDVITKISITDMHEQVRAAINAVPPSSLGRGTFNMFQLPSLISKDREGSFHMYDIAEVTEGCDVKYLNDQAETVFSDTEPNKWDELVDSDGENPYVLPALETDNTNWNLSEDDVVFVFFCCRVKSTSATNREYQMWLGLHKTINDSLAVDAVDIGCVRLGNNSPEYNSQLEETITIASAFSGSTFGASGDWVLNKLRVHGVMIAATGAAPSPGVAPVFRVEHGTLGAVVLKTNGIQT